MKRIAVYCGSSYGDSAEYARAAATVGRLIADNGSGLVFGGAEVGLMGAVADSYLSAGGTELIGVLPERFSGMAHSTLTDLRITTTMHERKQVMFDLADGFIILPGGLGTLDEMAEIVEWARLGMHTKPVGLLDTAGYYYYYYYYYYYHHHLLKFLDHVAALGFCSQTDRALLLTDADPARLITMMRDYRSPITERWWSTVEATARVSARLVSFNPHDESVLVDPYPVYARYRRHDPVHWGAPYTAGGKGCWYLFRHEDVAAVLKDRRFRREWPEGAAAARRENAPAGQRAFWEVFHRLLLSTDPPEHRRLRTLAGKAFTPQVTEQYRPMVHDAADRLSEALPSDFDVIEDYAALLSFNVICTIIGVPLADSARLRGWITQFGGGLDLRPGSQAMREASTAAENLIDYFRALVALRRVKPEKDLLTGLIEARDDADKLSENELLAMCVQLLFAGHETTTGQIGITIYNLLRDLDQLALVRRDPELIPAAVGESLRLNGSVQTAAARKPVEDVTIGGELIRAGQPVIAFIGAANRDPERFPHPDTFDLHRDQSATVAFGAGIHYCLGAHLARMEAEAGVAALLRARPTLRLHPDAPPSFRANIVLPGLSHLPVSA